MPELDHQLVLVVEDEFYLATDVARLLRGARASVLGPYPSSRAALDALGRQRPDCAVLDINLGAGADFTLADALRKAGVPFVFFTGYDRDVIPQRFADVPRLLKPVHDRRLVETVAELCSAERPKNQPPQQKDIGTIV